MLTLKEVLELPGLPFRKDDDVMRELRKVNLDDVFGKDKGEKLSVSNAQGITDSYSGEVLQQVPWQYVDPAGKQPYEPSPSPPGTPPIVIAGKHAAGLIGVPFRLQEPLLEVFKEMFDDKEEAWSALQEHMNEVRKSPTRVPLLPKLQRSAGTFGLACDHEQVD